MNVLREFRKIRKKKLLIKLKLVCLLAIFLIVSTYAWWSIGEAKITGLQGNVTSWGIEYYVNNKEITSETIKFTLDKFYPGMEKNIQTVQVRNVGDSKCNITLEITSVKLFGEDITNNLKTNNEVNVAGGRINLFTNTRKYPFNVNCVADKTTLTDNYTKKPNSRNATADIQFNVEWPYDGNNDELDTEYGKKAYQYSQRGLENQEECLIIEILITSSRIL